MNIIKEKKKKTHGHVYDCTVQSVLKFINDSNCTDEDPI